MTDDQKRRAGYHLWRLLTALLLALVGAWDAVGLLAASEVGYASPSYDVLRLAPWGMRSYGPPLAVLVAVATYAFGRHRFGDFQLLRVSLTLLACWYLFWLLCITGTWVVNGQIQAWGAVGKLLFTASVAFVLARTTPTFAPPREAIGVAVPQRPVRRHAARR